MAGGVAKQTKKNGKNLRRHPLSGKHISGVICVNGI